MSPTQYYENWIELAFPTRIRSPSRFGHSIKSKILKTCRLVQIIGTSFLVLNKTWLAVSPLR